MVHTSRSATDMPADETTGQRAAFERHRLEVIAHHGFEAESTWFSDAAGRRTYAMTGGAGSCPKILIHGGLSEGSEWWPLAGRLRGRVVIPDRPGCGLTYVPDPRRRDFRGEAVAWVEHLVDALEVPHVDLIGNSMGGYFSIVFALAHPDRVRRLTLVGAPAGLHRGLPLFIRLWGHPLVGRAISRRPIDDPEKLRAVFQRLLVTHADTIPTEALQVMVEAAALPGVGRYAFLMLRRLTNLRGVRRGLIISSEMPGLGVPTRFVWGEDDAFSRPASAADVWDRMPNADLRRIPEAGHLPQLDRPDDVAEAVSSFLDDARMRT